MPIHRQFTASCDDCNTPFTGDGIGYAFVVNGVAQYSDELKQAMKQHGWCVGNQQFCPTCRCVRNETPNTNTKEVSQ